MDSTIIKEKEQVNDNLFNNQDYQLPIYLRVDDSVYFPYDEDTIFLKFIDNLNKRIKADYFKKQVQIEEIQKFISSLASKNENILNMITVDDPEKEVSKIFVLKIPESVSPEERMNIRSKIIDKCLEYSKKQDMMDTFMDTAIFVRR